MQLHMGTTADQEAARPIGMKLNPLAKTPFDRLTALSKVEGPSREE